MKKKICLVIFIVLFVVSILVNVKLLFFSPAVSLKNIPFEGVITDANEEKQKNSHTEIHKKIPVRLSFYIYKV